MSEQTSQEPTMEEILASIRRIISEDDAPAAEGPTGPTAEELAAKAREGMPPLEGSPELEINLQPLPEPEAPPEDDDTLELTDKVESHGDLDVVAASALAPEPIPETEPLVSDVPASIAAAAFGQLSATIGMGRADRTLEDVVRELLRPLLQQWLDENLPRIVQQAVDGEVERIARGRVR